MSWLRKSRPVSGSSSTRTRVGDEGAGDEDHLELAARHGRAGHLGQEDYVFGSREKDARHWNSYLLKIFQEHADTLSPLFNSGASAQSGASQSGSSQSSGS